MKRSAVQLEHAELHEVRRCVAELHSAVLRAAMNGHDPNDPAWNELVPEMGAKLLFVRARVWAGHEEFSEDLLEYSGRLSSIFGDMPAEGWPAERLRALARNISATLGVWQMDPATYLDDREPIPTVDEMMQESDSD